MRRKKETQEVLPKMKTSLKTWMTNTPTPKPPQSKYTNENPPNPNPSRQLNTTTVKNKQKTVENCVEEEKKTVIEEDLAFKKAQKKFSQAEKPKQNLNSFEIWKKERQNKRKRSKEGIDEGSCYRV